MSHIYVFVRKDLPHSQIVVQACHACIEATICFLNKNTEHPSLVVCGIRNEQQLQKVFSRLLEEGVHCCPFIEPDRGNELTSFATEPISSERRHLFRRYNCLNLGFP
jgi:hypothetical protein